MDSVHYSQGLHPPGHVAAFFRIRGQASKGLTNSADRTMVFVMIRGEITVMIHSLQFMATRGDIIKIHRPTQQLQGVPKKMSPSFERP